MNRVRTRFGGGVVLSLGVTLAFLGAQGLWDLPFLSRSVVNTVVADILGPPPTEIPRPEPDVKYTLEQDRLNKPTPPRHKYTVEELDRLDDIAALEAAQTPLAALDAYLAAKEHWKVVRVPRQGPFRFLEQTTDQEILKTIGHDLRTRVAYPDGVHAYWTARRWVTLGLSLSLLMLSGGILSVTLLALRKGG